MKSTSITRFLMSFLLLICMGMGFAQETDVPEKLYQDYKKDGIEKALEAYNQMPVRGNEYTFLSEPLNLLGYRLMGEGDLDAAEKAFLAQIDEYPNEANPYDSYADLLMEKGDETQAKKHYQKAIELSATIEDAQAKQQMLEASKGKLARLENEDIALKFLTGNWSTKTFAIQNGEKSLTNEGRVEFSSEGNNSVLIGEMYNPAGNYMGSRILAYDAIDGEYDMAYISNNLTGIEPSTLKIMKATPEEVVMVENFEENGKKMKIKHILNKTDKEIAWDIHDLSNGEETNMVAQMVFTRDN